MRLTSCAASLARSRTRWGRARTGWNRRTGPTGWPYAVGSWLPVSWSTSPTSLISRAAHPAEAMVKHQGACGGRYEYEQGEHVVVADDQFQPAPGELDRPVVALVRREKQPPARQHLVADRHGPPAKQADYQRDAEDPVAEAPGPVRGEHQRRYHVNVVVRPADRRHQQAGRGARHQAE